MVAQLKPIKSCYWQKPEAEDTAHGFGQVNTEDTSQMTEPLTLKTTI